jgi:hypothetical protein
VHKTINEKSFLTRTRLRLPVQPKGRPNRKFKWCTKPSRRRVSKLGQDFHKTAGLFKKFKNNLKRKKKYDIIYVKMSKFTKKKSARHHHRRAMKTIFQLEKSNKVFST